MMSVPYKEGRRRVGDTSWAGVEIGGQEPGACVVTALSAIIGRQLQEERTHQQLQSGSV